MNRGGLPARPDADVVACVRACGRAARDDGLGELDGGEKEAGTGRPGGLVLDS